MTLTRTLAVVAAACLAWSAQADEPASGVLSLEYARPFVAAEAFPYTHLRDQPMTTEGMILELRVDPATMVPRQVDVPVLYVGDTPAKRTNWDHRGGCGVFIVRGQPDLTTTPIYFGSAELPERVDAEIGAAELAAAEVRGVAPFAKGEVEAALGQGGELLRVDDLRGVYREVADRLEGCAPHEVSRIEGYRK